MGAGKPTRISLHKKQARSEFELLLKKVNLKS